MKSQNGLLLKYNSKLYCNSIIVMIHILRNCEYHCQVQRLILLLGMYMYIIMYCRYEYLLLYLL